MLTQIHPKLPMRDKERIKDFYVSQLGFSLLGDYRGYLLLRRDDIEIHFFASIDLNPKKNYGQVYIRTNAIDHLYQSFIDSEVSIHPNGGLQNKAWGQREFSILDPDNNLLTFGQAITI